MNMRRLSMSGTLLPLPLDLLDANQRPAKSIGMSRELYRCIAGRFQSGNNYSRSRWGIIWMTFLQDSSNLHSFPKLLLRCGRSSASDSVSRCEPPRDSIQRYAEGEAHGFAERSQIETRAGGAGLVH
jgi:hypothetical protein